MMAQMFRIREVYSLQQKVLHEIAKMCWGECVLRSNIDAEEISVPEKIRELNAHFDSVLNKLPDSLNALPKAFSADLPRFLTEKVFDAVICLRQGYKEALIWEERYMNTRIDLPFTVLNPTEAGSYQAGCFINPTGQFDDWNWAKLFVSDEEQQFHSRFQLACYYCFEEEIKNMWNIMKKKGELPCKVVLTRILHKSDSIVHFWVDQLENKIHELSEAECRCMFILAVTGGHEYAVRYFLSCCTDIGRLKIIKGFLYHWIFIDAGPKMNYTGVVYFLYSVLTLEQKNILIEQTIGYDREIPSIWTCLLDSPYYKIVLNEILTFPFVIPSGFYALIFKDLAYKSRESLNPIPLKIFEILCNHLLFKQRKLLEVFAEDFYIIFLIQIKALDFVEFAIPTLSRNEKAEILCTDWCGGGWTAIDLLSKNGDYDDILRYLLFFLINRNPFTSKLSLTADALSFFNDYIMGMFTYWTKNIEPDSKIDQISEVIECLEGSLCTVDHLLQQVELNSID